MRVIDTGVADLTGGDWHESDWYGSGWWRYLFSSCLPCTSTEQTEQRGKSAQPWSNQHIQSTLKFCWFTWMWLGIACQSVEFMIYICTCLSLVCSVSFFWSGNYIQQYIRIQRHKLSILHYIHLHSDWLLLSTVHLFMAALITKYGNVMLLPHAPMNGLMRSHQIVATYIAICQLICLLLIWLSLQEQSESDWIVVSWCLVYTYKHCAYKWA